MAKMTLDSKEWLKHLGQFDGINDLKVHLTAPSTLSYSVGYQTHYFTVSEDYDNAIEKSGEITVSDLEKVCAFLKKCSGDVTFKQLSNGKTLYIANDSLKMQIPVTDCKSTQLVPIYEGLVKKAEKNMWQTFGNDTYTVHGKAELADMLKLSSLKKLINSGSDYFITANAESGEISINAGKEHNVKLYATTKLNDAEGPAYTVRSNYGSWLLPCLAYIEAGTESEVHFGAATGFVVEQKGDKKKRLLIVIDQEE
tara:strand:+ start:157 stop:918 length:762 start_codon:yes stop_codon:yes gene_type:complete